MVYWSVWDKIKTGVSNKSLDRIMGSRGAPMPVLQEDDLLWAQRGRVREQLWRTLERVTNKSCDHWWPRSARGHSASPRQASESKKSWGRHHCPSAVSLLWELPFAKSHLEPEAGEPLVESIQIPFPGQRGREGRRVNGAWKWGLKVNKSKRFPSWNGNLNFESRPHAS